ncbi:hypothetical protein DW753_12975 [Agathobacter rectalis]|uniref:Uncharacterized protein n=1 Tax=Agathobacter rectalis TaxID=39491 RepID=A0A395UV46_9FIRM|nr:hypothetical protein DWY38_14535 [Agathobacter rectalis]RGT08110.1 hypothetical protein DWX52_13225 [Agathobacter rectalis]RGT16161.1 hypothetical protein DWX50_13345 [Agathobacter rectalis]RHE30763.1 hypothetical protein DW753_12975 [Agathobacter rectalis]
MRFQSVFEGYTFDKLQIYFQLRWHPLSRLGEPIKVIKKMKQTDNFKFAELTKIKPVRKMTFLRTGFCVAFSNDIYLFCN